MKERCEILLAIALCCYSCSPTSNSEGQYNESYLSNVDYLTSHRPLDEGDVVDVQGLIFTEAGLLANQKFVDKDRSSIAAYDTGGLSKLWEWTEAYDDYGIDGFRGGGHSVRQYVYNGTLITYERNILFKLDLNDGRTIVKAKFDNTLVGLDGVGNFAPTAYTVSDLDERIGYIDIETQGYIEIDAHAH
jgi:hypothetical protein